MAHLWKRGWAFIVKEPMKKAIVALWIIGMLLGTPAFAGGNPQSSIPFPDPALIGRPGVPYVGVSPYNSRPGSQPYPGVSPYVGRPVNQPYIGINHPYRPTQPPIVLPQPIPVITNVHYVTPDYVSFIKKLEAIPERKIDIGMVALILAKDVYPNLDIKAYSRRIDKIAAEIKKITNGSKDPDWRIRVMNSYLYRKFGIHYAYDDPCAEKKEHRYINGILDYKEGCCVSMPTFYMAVGQRLGYPIYAVSAPQHNFLRYVDPKFKEQNIEATEGGGYSPDEHYRKDFEVSAKALKSGAYLRTLSHREFLGYLISQNGNYWLSKGDVNRAVYYLAAARRMYPKSADICRSFGNALLVKSRLMTGPAAIQTANTGKECLQTAEEMGVEHLPMKGYFEEVKKAKAIYMRELREHKLTGAY